MNPRKDNDGGERIQKSTTNILEEETPFFRREKSYAAAAGVMFRPQARLSPRWRHAHVHSRSSTIASKRKHDCKQAIKSCGESQCGRWLAWQQHPRRHHQHQPRLHSLNTVWIVAYHPALAVRPHLASTHRRKERRH